MSKPTCQARCKDGGPCRAPALPGSTLCWSHDPRQQRIAAEARADGARKAARLRTLGGRRRRLEQAGRLAPFLAELVEDTLAGRVDVGVARCCFYGAGVLRAVIETSELERRVCALEAQRRPQRGGDRWA